MIETSFSLLIHPHPIILIPPAKKHFLELINCKNRALCHPAKSQTALTKIDLERVQSWPVPFKTKHCWLKPTEHCWMKPQQESLNLNPVKNCGFGNPHHICKIRFEPPKHHWFQTVSTHHLPPNGVCQILAAHTDVGEVAFTIQVTTQRSLRTLDWEPIELLNIAKLGAPYLAKVMLN